MLDTGYSMRRVADSPFLSASSPLTLSSLVPREERETMRWSLAGSWAQWPGHVSGICRDGTA